MDYPTREWDIAMKVEEVLIRGISGQLSWVKAAEILGYTTRHLRRLRHSYQAEGIEGLINKRRGQPSSRRVSMGEMEQVFGYYRDTYFGYSVQHFHDVLTKEYGFEYSYNFLRAALQKVGLVSKNKSRGRHHKKRPPKESFGEMLHIDGSFHPWLTLCPDEKQALIVVADDATKAMLYAQLWPQETTESIMHALWHVIATHGIPMSLYTDRASWAFVTPVAGEKVDKKNLTHVGKALHHLGIEHIPAYSPQARGRSERLNRTLQDRLIKELRVAGVSTMKKANQYLNKVFIPDYNQRFTCPPIDSQQAFVQVAKLNLQEILCEEHERKVYKDNTVKINTLVLQIDKQPGRRTCAGLYVTVRHYLDGTYGIWHGHRHFGLYDNQGNKIKRTTRKVA